MSDFDDRGRRIPDQDELREAAKDRMARWSGCKCLANDWPGFCPGWRHCPMHMDEVIEEEEDNDE